MTEKQILRQAEIEQRKFERAEKKLHRDAEIESKKKSKETPERSEAEIVRSYANRVIKNSIYHGRVDQEKFKGMEHSHSVSKNLWMDTDFFFSVVFQSATQKRAFLESLLKKFEGDIAPDEDYGIQIINGLELAEVLGIKLEPETSREYPTASIDLLPLVLDNEST